MRIEINTKDASSEELLHLSELLLSLSGKQRDAASQSISQNTSGESYGGVSSSDGGFMSMFGDAQPVNQPPAQPAAPSMSQSSQVYGSSDQSSDQSSPNDVFSLFSEPSTPSQPTQVYEEPKKDDSIRIVEY